MKDVNGRELNHCPFGCTDAELDERNYCAHLVGFTNDNKRIELLIWNHRNQPVVTCKTVQKVGKKDVLVNPEYPQKTESGTHMMKLWVSARVYRDCTADEALEWYTKHVKAEVEELAEAV
jgi:hypothetical protein